MDFLSLGLSRELGDVEINDFGDLLGIEGKICRVIVVSAYVDIRSISQLIDFAEKNADKRRRATLQIFIDKLSSRFSSDREIRNALLALQKKITKCFCSESGLYVVDGWKLFHGKLYLVEGNTVGKVFLGSLNLTQKGLLENEEILCQSGYTVGSREKSAHFVKSIDAYVDSILKNYSEKISAEIKERTPSSIRHLLLGGQLYYEQKENSPLRFKLNLPPEVIKNQSILDSLLEANITDSISLEHLITSPGPIGLGMNLPEIRGNQVRWKKFCVQTCFGYWSPTCLYEDLNGELRKRRKVRRPYFDELFRVVRNDRDKITGAFIDLCTRVNEKSKALSVDFDKWEYSEKNCALESWRKWYDDLLAKIENEKLYERLITGIASVPVPDVWNDPIATDEFESSFLDSMIYEWSKENSKSTSNLISKNISWNLDLTAALKSTIDVDELKIKITEWLKANKNINILLIDGE